MSNERIVCWFSCGAASAVATKLAIAHNNKNEKLPLVIAYTEVCEEHPDNSRFLSECEKWFGQEIQIIGNHKYEASIYEVFRKERFLKGPSGAACTRLLKKGMRKQFEQPGDRQVFGYTVEEQRRVDQFIDANNDVDIWAPLIDKGLAKQDCLALLAKEGIELPAMYKLGYKNNNCIGCVKGEAGYWNKIRVDFPEAYERMAMMEEHLGRTVCKIGMPQALKRYPDKVRHLIATDEPLEKQYWRPTLRELPKDAGSYEAESDISCGIFCELAQSDLVS
jgi:hypothetical protein